MTAAPSAWLANLLLFAALAIGAYRGFHEIHRPGYLLDEEITVAVTPSVSHNVVPRLPSGLLYVRGLPYTYLAWSAGIRFGHSLATYRSVSLFCALAAIVGIYWAGRRVCDPLTAGAAAVLLATFETFNAASAFARPYAMFAAALSVTIALFFRAFDGRSAQWPFLAGLAMSRLLHEFGIALICLPLVAAVVLERTDDRRRGLVVLFIFAAGLALSLELVLFAVVNESLNRLFVPLTVAPAFRPLRLPPLPPLHLFEVGTVWSFATLIGFPLLLLTIAIGRRTRRWLMAVMCGILAMAFQLGSLAAWTVITSVCRPRVARQLISIGGVMFVAGIALWTTHTFVMSAMQPSWTAIPSLARPMLQYPLGSVLDFSGSYPWMAIGLSAAVVSLLVEGDATGAYACRSVALFMLIVFAGFGVLGITSQPRFWVLGLPVIALTAAHGLVRTSSRVAVVFPRWTAFSSSLVHHVALLLALGSVLYLGRAASDRPPLTSVAARIDTQPNDTVICSEELACKYLVGRVDYLLLGHPTDLAYYTGRREGQFRGLYANSPVLNTAESLTALVMSTKPPARLVAAILDTGKIDAIACLDIVKTVAARFGVAAYRTDDAYVFYLSRDAAGIATLR